ncbi:MAG: hypothetical protein CMK92_06735 [Pseudomonas sp.]|nr:hypothetical protein [Pseudomonas sp.]|tara:strand:- start:1040 stop:1798 length:759 start_codon:yes stop_codon:yes gene_type:complete
MPVFDCNGKQLVYVHIPKTGGTSVESFINEINDVKSMFFSNSVLEGMQVTPQHLPLTTIKSVMGRFYNPDYIFTIVRNPYHRAESEFKYRMDLGLFKNIPFKEKFFNIWLLYTVILESIAPGRLDNHMRPQSYFLTSDVFIYKLEDGMERAIESIKKELGLESRAYESIASKKVSTKRNLSWSRSSIKLVSSYYNDDFVNLGYDPNEIRAESSFLRESLHIFYFTLFISASCVKRTLFMLLRFIRRYTSSAH